MLLFVCFVAFLGIIGVRNKLSNSDSKGKPPINKYLFLLAKLTLFSPWILTFLRAYEPELLSCFFSIYLAWLGIFLVFPGILFIVIGYVSLGKYTKFGLPTNESKLITNGIYKYSRNPMYVGLFLMVIGSVLYFPHWILIVCIIITFILHHQITLAEEKFLRNAFGKEWEEYKTISKRYL